MKLTIILASIGLMLSISSNLTAEDTPPQENPEQKPPENPPEPSGEPPAEEPKKPEEPDASGEKPKEPPQRSRLNVNLINATGKPVYIRAKVQVAGDPTQFMEAQGLSKDDFTTIATLHTDPNKEFEIIKYQGDIAGAAQLVIADNKGLNMRCKIVDEGDKEKGNKKAKKSIDFYVKKGENESYPSCHILFDYEP